jgi:ribonuclease HI
MKRTIQIFCDGAGAGPDGRGSGFAWIREDTKQRHVERRNGLTNNEAEYLAIVSALKRLRAGTEAEVLTDSQLVVSQLRGEFRIRELRLEKLVDEVKTLIERKRLTVKFTWVRRSENKAGKLL